MLKPDLPTIAPPAGSAMWSRDFLFGAATAAYQIEGSVEADGRLPSIWDTFCRVPSTVHNGDSGDVACDHYNRWEADLQLLNDLGFDAYRFSVSWSRVMNVDGTPNHKGLDFYKRLIEQLEHRGLKRFLTLYHWDLPQHLQDRGGWLTRETSFRFAEYADLLSRELAGGISAWTTLNEPYCSAYLGHATGRHAPGMKQVQYAVDAMHHLLLGHGLATASIRANDGAPVGLVSNVNAVVPMSHSAADEQAATLAYAHANTWVLDPLLLGRYPAELKALWPGIEAPIQAGDMAAIATRMDYLGINYYFRAQVRADAEAGYVEVPMDGVERTQMGWVVYPDGLRDLLIDFKNRYPGLPPIYITENGMASDDKVVDGRVADEQRVRYLNTHIAAVDQAMRAGVQVKGYFAWSLLDNFEWSYGYEKRFGVVHVDYATQRRTPKDSALAMKTFLERRRHGA